MFKSLEDLNFRVYATFGDEKIRRLSRGKSSSVWFGNGIKTSILFRSINECDVYVEASLSVSRIFVRWKHEFRPSTLILGDAWERSYGELEWRAPNPDRMMPWYFIASAGGLHSGLGVKTGSASLAAWTADSEGITLELDVRCGGEGVVLENRSLHTARVVYRTASPGQSAHTFAQLFCRELCDRPARYTAPIVGHNDWYWLYGKNSARHIVEATQRMVDLCPSDAETRPWSIVDDGWQLSSSTNASNGGPWDKSNSTFPDMPGLADRIHRLGAKPGIWFRPLLTKSNIPDHWKGRCPVHGAANGGNILDPSCPEVLHLVSEDIKRLCAWGYKLIKHDFSTVDCVGRWGFEMTQAAGGFTSEGWRFSDPTKTTAETLGNLYQVIRAAAGSDVVLMGCNTVGHLAAGLVEIQRTGDDTSAFDWSRTRRMGVNTLAFRSVQHNSFFAIDADCVPITPHISWELSSSWMELVAKSGTPLFLSIDPLALNTSRTDDIRRAIEFSFSARNVANPLDWMDSPFPRSWEFSQPEGNHVTKFSWDEMHLEEEESINSDRFVEAMLT